MLDTQSIATAICILLAAAIVYLAVRSDGERAATFVLPPPTQCEPGWRGRELDEPSIKVAGSTAIQCYAPATGSLLALVNPSTPDGIDRTIAKAAAAQQAWKTSSFAQRRKLLNTLLKFIFDHQESIVRAACLDTGKTRTDALFGEILVTVSKLKWTIRHGEAVLSPNRRATDLLTFYKHNEVRYEPLGVVAA